MVASVFAAYIDGMMTIAMTKIESKFEPAGLQTTSQQLANLQRGGEALRDYDAVRRTIAFISENWRTQPTIASGASI